MTLSIPTPPRGAVTAAVSNVLFLAGLAAAVVAVGLLADWRWALLASAPCLGFLGWLYAQPETSAKPRALRSAGKAA